MKAVVLFCLVAIQVICAEKLYQLVAPKTYTVLGGEIQVEYRLPRNASDKHKIRVESETEVIFAVPVQGGEGSLSFICGVIDYAGSFIFKLLDQDDQVLTESAVMVAKWPETKVILPHRQSALSKDIEVQVNVTGTQCKSLHTDAGYRLKVTYNGVNDTHGQPKDSRTSVDIFTKEYIDILRLSNARVSISCRSIDQAGVYLAELRSIRNPRLPLTVSNAMYVHWSTVYELTSSSDSVFPCTGNVIVHFVQARCSGTEDKVRMYRQVRRTSSSIASPIDLEYVAERRALPSELAVTFECHRFDPDDAGYCFIYVSTASSGAVTEQYSLCLPTHPSDEPVVDGRWGPWSTWTSCSTTCGPGQRVRHRACDSPAPSFGGQYCRGDSNSYKACDHPCHAASTLHPLQYTPNPECECGCMAEEPQGKIIGTTHCRDDTRWILVAPEGHVIKLSFQDLSLDPENSLTQLYVRDGDSTLSELLVQTSGGDTPKSVVSSGRIMSVELKTAHGGSQQEEGFQAVYVSLAQNVTAGGGDGSGDVKWESAVTVVGIVLCVIILLVTLGLVCHHKISKKNNLKNKQIAANQSLLVNGEIANSPSHSGGSFQGAVEGAYGEGSPSKRDYILATKGVTVDFDKRKTNNRSPTRNQATTPQSPYTANARKGDFIHEPDMLTVHPVPPESPHKRQRSRDTREDNDRRRSSGKHRSPTKSSSRSRSRSPQKSPHGRPPRAPGAPLAGGEDLSPVSPISPGLRRLSGGMQPITENIQMDSMHGKQRSRRHRSDFSPTDLPAQRPPVEGRDSLSRKKGRRRSTSPEKATSTDYQVKLPASTLPQSPDNDDVKNGNCARANLKPLPLRDVQRPDGQSPEHKAYDPNSNSPGLSPILQNDKLFPDSGSAVQTPAEVGSVDFEYDDIPELPGSCFSMDPHAYTLTWSHQTPWGQKNGDNRSQSRASGDTHSSPSKF